MQRTWRILTLSTLIVSTLATKTSLAEGTGENKTTDQPPNLGTIAKKLDEINQSLKPLNDLKTAITSLEARVKSLDEFIQQELQKIRGGAYETNLKMAQAQADIQELKKQIAQLQQNLDALNRRPTAPQTQTSGYAGPAVPVASTGRVRLVNTYNRMMTIRVNNSIYEVLPGQERFVEALPAGTFVYEVLGVSLPQERTLASGETFTVTVYPR
jgi:hypothetical protein